jgi:hypothetical protein
MKLQFPWRKYQMIQACIDFADLRLWEQYENLDFFVVETPLEDPVVASIMGMGGQEYGLSVFRGPDAFKQPFFLDNSKEAAIEKINTIGFSMSRYDETEHHEKKWLKSCNFRARGSDWVPCLLSKAPGQMADLVEKDRDIRLMLYVLKGILKAHEEGDFNPKIAPSGSTLLTLQVSGDETDPDVHVVRKSFPGSKELLKYCSDAISFEMPEVSELPRLDETWLVVPIYTAKAKTERDICTLVIAEEKSRFIFFAEIIETATEEALDVLYDVFFGNNAAKKKGVPRTIIIAEQALFDAMGKHLKQSEIDIRCQVNHPLANEFRKNSGSLLPNSGKGRTGHLRVSSDIDLSIIPGDDDLAGWKTIQSALTNRFIDFWNTEDKLRTDRLSKQFFGDSDWEYYIDKYADTMSLPTYVTWAVMTYRDRKEDRTFAETLLASDLPRPLHISLEAMNNAYPSLYQVVKTDKKAGTIQVEDLLLSETFIIHDQGLSMSSVPNMIAPFWIYSVGRFHFINIAGPVFGFPDIERVIKKLQKLGLPPTISPEWLRRNAHIFGRLWQLYDDIALGEPQLPLLKNTDGDPLEYITACFTCGNPASVQNALQKRTDMDFDDQEDTYIWFKGDLDVLMKNTLLGRICFKKNSIEVEVNSKKRFDGVKKILESIQGIRYLSHTTKKAQDMLKKMSSEQNESPRKILPPEKPLPEEVRLAAAEHLGRYYMEWLDTPIPAFGNQSPRQASKNPKMAQQVRIMIKSIPDPLRNTGGSVPKKEMLESLGLSE